MAPAMNAIARRLARGATDLIRRDHTQVLAIFHRYSLDATARTKRGIADTVCLAIEVHAQLEEEIFYPALRAAGSQLVDKSFPEHAEIKDLIATLRHTDAADVQFDANFMDLMRAVIHHVADEETVLLPQAESLMAERLPELGAQMTKRRLQLAAPRTGEMARNVARALPPRAMLVGVGALLAGALAMRRLRRPA